MGRATIVRDRARVKPNPSSLGEKAANLAVIQLTKFELILNLQTAKALSLSVPTAILAIVDEAIE